MKTHTNIIQIAYREIASKLKHNTGRGGKAYLQSTKGRLPTPRPTTHLKNAWRGLGNQEEAKEGREEV